MSHLNTQRSSPAAAFGFAVLAMAAQARAAAPPPNATFRIVHAIAGRDLGETFDPQLPVDVLVANTFCIVRNLTYRSFTAPLSVPAGTYNFKVSLANPIRPCSNTPVIDEDETLTAGEEAAVAAVQGPSGALTCYIFPFNGGLVPSSKGRLVVVNGARAPAIDVLVDGRAAIDGLRVGAGGSTDLPAGKYRIAVRLPDRSESGVEPIALSLPRGSLTLIAAVGSSATGSLSLTEIQLPFVH